MTKEKRYKIKDIAKRHAKAKLMATDTSNFMDSGLSEEDAEFVSSHVRFIGSSITKNSALWDGRDIAKNYNLTQSDNP